MDVKLEKCTDLHSKGSVDDDGFPYEETEEEIRDEPDDFADFKLRFSTDEEMSSNDDDEQRVKVKTEYEFHDIKPVKLENDLIFDTENCNVEEENRIDSKFSDPELQTLLMKENFSITSARTRIYTRAINGRSYIDRLYGSKILVPNRTVRIKMENDSCESNEDSDYLSTSRASSDCNTQADNSKYILRSSNHFSPEVKTSTQRFCYPTRRRVSFSDADNETIINWLIKNKLIPLATGRKIWQQLLDEKVLPAVPTRKLSSGILLRHFHKVLKHHPTFVRYNKGVKILKTLKIDNRRPFTEQEDKVLINYLIKNDVIHRARGNSVWIECLKKHRKSLNPSRTHISLGVYFRQKLRYNYAKYTEDPEALWKFNQIECGTSKKKKKK